MALSCASTGGRIADPRPVTPALVAEYQDKPCRPFHPHARDDADAQCGPFVCKEDRCVVQKCGPTVGCEEGVCSEGYCHRVTWGGRGRCPDGDPDLSESERTDAYWRRMSGCLCQQKAELSMRGTACGGFPCLENGCYVHKCRHDDDCKKGFCASHTGRPGGYCVNSDAY
jgi:hypothetical protein